MAVPTNVLLYIILGLGLAGLVAVITWLGFLTNNKNNGNEIQKQLAIVSAVTGVLVLIFGGAAYMYFTTDVNALTPFLLIMAFVNMFLSLVAVSTASLGVTYA
jgi:hypothetical protein